MSMEALISSTTSLVVAALRLEVGTSGNLEAPVVVATAGSSAAVPKVAALLSPTVEPAVLVGSLDAMNAPTGPLFLEIFSMYGEMFLQAQHLSSQALALAHL